MNRAFLAQGSLHQIEVPVGISGSDSAYFVSDNALAPIVRSGDIVCCGARVSCCESWPTLALVSTDGVTLYLAPFRPKRAIMWLARVELILRH